MKREIKFRGKTLSGGFVYGNLLHYTNPYEGDKVNNGCIIVTEYKSDKDNSFKIVDPETIGQFTGLLDKNGKEIYEGDIIRSYDSENNPIIHSISWDNKKACYVAIMLQYPLLGGSIDKGWIDEFEKEVIGNVFDNPELLKGGAE